MIGYFAKGHSLSKEIIKTRKSLEKSYISRISRMTEKSKIEFETLIRSFINQSSLRPHELFDLNLSSGLTASGLLVTYVVVLMQLKVSESQHDSI